MKWLLYMLLLVLLSGLSACQSGLLLAVGGNDFQELSAKTLVLHKDIRIPPRQAHAVFQGVAFSYGSGEYAPQCQLEVSKVQETAQTVHAGVFEITSVRGITHYVQRPRRIQLAATADFQLLADDSAEWIMLAYHFSLYSEEQPDVIRLICGGAYDFPFYARYPSEQQIRQSLGDSATVSLP
jgi:hypothetical protein